MPQSGLINTRTKPRVTVLRGFDPNAPMTMTQSLPVAVSSGLGTTGQKSGQVISSTWDPALGSYAWVLGLTGAALTAGSNKVSKNTPFIALQDAADEDVIEAGKLTGLSCAGQFEIQTAYYTSGTYYVGSQLKADASTLGNVTLVSATGDIVIGQVTRAPVVAANASSTAAYSNAFFTLSASYTGGSGSATGIGAVFYPGTDSSAVAPNQVICFATNYSGFGLPATY